MSVEPVTDHELWETVQILTEQKRELQQQLTEAVKDAERQRGLANFYLQRLRNALGIKENKES